MRPSVRQIGWLSAAVYAANAIHYGWSPSNRSWIDDAAAWAANLALLALYWLGYRVLTRAQGPCSLRNVVLPAVPLVVISFLTVPYDSTDAFLYAAIGQAESQYGMNPYTSVLRDLPDTLNDPAIATSWMDVNGNPWRDLPLVYGFAFALLIRALAWAGQGHLWLILALIKAINVLAYAGTIAMLWKVSSRFGEPRPDVVVYLFAWSPLVLLHHMANAHNDILMGALILSGFYLLVRDKSMWSPAALTVAALIKYVTLPLIPLFVFAIARREGWRRALTSAALAAVPAILLSLPFIASVRRFRFDLMSAQLAKVTAGSLYGFIFYVYRYIAGTGSLPVFGSALKVFLWTVAIVMIVRVCAEFYRRRQPTVEDLALATASILFAIIFIGSSQFYSWYIGMLLPIALILRTDHWLRRLTVLLNGTHIFSLTSLSRKAVGYFVLTSGLALAALRAERR